MKYRAGLALLVLSASASVVSSRARAGARHEPREAPPFESAQQNGQADALRASHDGPAAENLRRTVQVLASDAFEGRLLGSEGSRAAARYMAAQFELLGLEPLGAEGTFLAPVQLVQRRFTAPPVLRLGLADGGLVTLRPGLDFGVFPNGVPEAQGVLSLVSAATEEELRDVAASDVALALLAAPARARRWLDAPELAERRPKVVLESGGARQGRPLEAGPFGPMAPTIEGDGAVRIALYGEHAAALEAGAYRSVEFQPNLSLEPVSDSNVVGLLRGVGTPERPALAEEALVVSAHRDHIGPQPIGRAGATESDQIANGADDDASGCAVALELARCLAAEPRLARSVVFVLVTGEESGMFGSKDYVARPAWPIERTVLNLNLEMLGMPDPLSLDEGGTSRPWLTGFERSTLGEALVGLGLAVVPDPRPRMNFFLRSDNVSFARVGIVAHTLSSGGDNPHYHQVRDEWHTLDYLHMARCAEVALGALRAVGSGTLTPVWREGEPRLGR